MGHDPIMSGGREAEKVPKQSVRKQISFENRMIKGPESGLTFGKRHNNLLVCFTDDDVQ